jgi:hypothetical protein
MICPSCQKGKIYNTWDVNFGKWREQCTECNFSRLYECRRKRQIPINFIDRRGNRNNQPEEIKKNQILHDLKRIALSCDKLYKDVMEIFNGKNIDNDENERRKTD